VNDLASLTAFLLTDIAVLRSCWNHARKKLKHRIWAFVLGTIFTFRKTGGSCEMTVCTVLTSRFVTKTTVYEHFKRCVSLLPERSVFRDFLVQQLRFQSSGVTHVPWLSRLVADFSPQSPGLFRTTSVFTSQLPFHQSINRVIVNNPDNGHSST